MKKITRVILILCMLMMSVEADMAKSDVDVPAWLRGGGGGNKGNDTLTQRPDNNKGNGNTLANKPIQNNNKGDFDEVQDAGSSGPSWSDYLMGVQNALNIASQIGAGVVGTPALTGNLMGSLAGNIAGGIQNQLDKGGADTLQNKGNKDKNKLANRMLAARSDTLRGGKGSMDTLRNAGGSTGSAGGFGGFGSRYGGNWGGGGSYGGGGGGGYSADPAWMNYLLNLYSWNIK